MRGLHPPVIADTSVYCAVSDRSDTFHHQGIAILRELLRTKRRLYTSNFVVAETHALVLTRIGRFMASRVPDEMESSENTTIVRITEADEVRARAILRQYDDKDWSLTDATSFAVMGRLGLHYVFTFDRNFAQFGWTVLVP